VSAAIVNAQLGLVLPAHGPAVQFAKRPDVGDANNVIAAPEGKLAVHVAPQSMPAGELVTVPVPPF
jgi:hypothetical protein